MGWPGSKVETTITSLNEEVLGSKRIKRVSVIDSPETIYWELGDQGLKVTSPLKASNKVAIVYKIEFY